ncbi:MAG TPA: hypothetical protein VMU54_06170 [Planctomycetota bacterium]|nr:hypothetical protein [Planctomycetota bacterium]
MDERMAGGPKRISGWKLVGLIAMVLAVLLLSYALYVHGVANRRWADMQRSVEELRSQCDLRNGPRPVLRGTAVPGNAWEDYSPALATMKSAPTGVLGEYVTRSPKADRKKLELALATHGTALDGLRKGAIRASGIYRVKWEEGFSADIPGLLQSQNLANLAVCRSRLLIEEGKPREAAELLLDTCQFARDLGYNQMIIAEMISIAIGGIALEELRDLILSNKLSRADLAEIACELEILDGSFPQSGHSMMNEVMMAGYTFLKSGGSLQDLDSWTGGGPNWDYFMWRAAFPQRLICTQSYFVELEYMNRFVAADGQSWGVSEAVGLHSEAEVAKLKNPISRMLIPGLVGANRAGRERRTQLRLLRAAAQYQATGEMPELADPFGGKLLSSNQGQKVKVWSVGRDRVDNGGKGGWKPNAGPDIVLEFDR